MRRGRVWLCTLGLVYGLSSFFLLCVYEAYVRKHVIGGGGNYGDHDTLNARRTAASVLMPFEKSTSDHYDNRAALNARSTVDSGLMPPSTANHRIHTCTLHNETISFPAAPNVILAGAMKAGTSYFWHLLRQHPEFVPSKKFEAHFFDWKFAVLPSQIKRPSFWQRFNATTEEEYLCAARKEYVEETFKVTSLLKATENQLSYEKTPNYMFLPQVPELIYKVCPWKPKIILILRNPVDRAYSHYVMDSAKDRVRLPFEEYIHLELESLRDQGLSNVPEIPASEWGALTETEDYLFEIPKNNMTEEEEQRANWMVYRQRHMRNYLQRGIYSVQLERWKNYFPLHQSLLVLNNERLIREPRKVMSEVLEFVGASRKDYFADESVSITIESEGDGKTSRGLSAGMKSLLTVGGYKPMSNATRQFLEKFYRPYNAKLGRLLGDEWESVWNYE